MSKQKVDPAAVSMLETRELLEDVTDRGGDPNVTIREIAQNALTLPGYLEEVGRLLSIIRFYFLSTRGKKTTNKPNVLISCCFQLARHERKKSLNSTRPALMISRPDIFILLYFFSVQLHFDACPGTSTDTDAHP